MTDWTTARVVRDARGRMLLRAESGRWLWQDYDDDGHASFPTAQVATFGPLVPILDADGLPVVRTVGDLTARHLGCEVAIDGMRPALLLAMRKPLPEEQLVAMLVSVYGVVTGTDYFPLGTPIEVLP